MITSLPLPASQTVKQRMDRAMAPRREWRHGPVTRLLVLSVLVLGVAGVAGVGLANLVASELGQAVETVKDMAGYGPVNTVPDAE